MKVLVRLCLVLGLIIILALLARFNNAQVLLEIAEYQIQMSLNLVIILWLFSCGLVYVLLRLIAKLKSIGLWWSTFKSQRQLELGQRYLKEAEYQFWAGDYARCRDAAQLARQSTKDASDRFASALWQYLALSKLGKVDLLAFEQELLSSFNEPKWLTSLFLAFARHNLQAGNLQQAHTYLEQLVSRNPEQSEAQFLALEILLAKHEYPAAFKLWTRLSKLESNCSYAKLNCLRQIFNGLCQTSNELSSIDQAYRELTALKAATAFEDGAYHQARVRLG